ncbi:MAG: MFS transporter [Actinomycetota bacterium]|nr:MFS transporter [Actinomycetota bacterium]MDH5314790.1 MFS transporter [Actinomycetota bacterium]
MAEREPTPDDREQELEATTGVRASMSLLRKNRDFRRLFLASVISLGGDWFLFVAITSLIVETTGRAIDVGLAILAQELAFFIASPPAGVLVDRLDRRKLMIACDLARIVVCASFLFVGTGTIWLAYPLLSMLSVFGAPFDPASTAATPNLVEPRDLPTANALNGSLWGTMLAVGAGLGGIVATVFGRDVAFIVDAASFGVSALLLWGIQRPFSEAREPGHTHPKMLDATIEVLQYARRDHRVLALIGVKAGFGLAAGVLALIPVFGAEVFHRSEIGVGALMAARGVGALVGPFLGHRLSGHGHRRLFSTIGLSLAVFGLAYMALGLAPTLWIAAGVIFVAHLGGGAQWVLSTFGLQVLVPDHIRGRVFAVDFAMITLSLAISSLIASAVADSAGPRRAALLVGAMAIVWAIVWMVLTRTIRRRTAAEGFSLPTVADG